MREMEEVPIRRRIGNVKQRDIDSFRDSSSHPVHGISAHQHKVGTTGFEPNCRVYHLLRQLIPVARMLKVLNLAKID